MSSGCLLADLLQTRSCTSLIHVCVWRRRAAAVNYMLAAQASGAAMPIMRRELPCLLCPICLAASRAHACIKPVTWPATQLLEILNFSDELIHRSRYAASALSWAKLNWHFAN